MKSVLITTITMIFFISCTNDITKSSEENPLLGKWSESFSWTNSFDCVTPTEGEIYCPPISETSTIEFTESNFEVKVLPPSRTFIIEDDTMYVGLAGDTLFTGSYELSNDMIIFYRDDSFDTSNVKFWFENDSLHLSAIGESNLIVIDGDTSYAYPFAFNSFVWGNAWFKTHGTFGKVK